MFLFWSRSLGTCTHMDANTTQSHADTNTHTQAQLHRTHNARVSFAAMRNVLVCVRNENTISHTKSVSHSQSCTSIWHPLCDVDIDFPIVWNNILLSVILWRLMPILISHEKCKCGRWISKPPAPNSDEPRQFCRTFSLSKTHFNAARIRRLTARKSNQKIKNKYGAHLIFLCNRVTYIFFSFLFRFHWLLAPQFTKNSTKTTETRASFIHSINLSWTFASSSTPRNMNRTIGKCLQLYLVLRVSRRTPFR